MMLTSIKLVMKSLEAGVSEASIVCSEQVHMEDKLPIQIHIVVQSVQFEGEQWSLELEQPS